MSQINLILKQIIEKAPNKNIAFFYKFIFA